MLRQVGLVVAIFATIALVGSGPVSAQPMMTQQETPPMKQDLAEQRLDHLFAGETEAEWFAPNFLAAVPAAQVSELVGGLLASFGRLVHVDLTGSQGTVRLERAAIPVRIRLDAQKRIDMLWFGPPQLTDVPLEQLAEELEAAANGQFSLLVTLEGKPLLEKQADVPLAVGSAFKLVVLKAYAIAVAQGRVTPDMVVPFEEADRSLPSGTLQVLPAGTPVTLDSLAALMIQISDNSATDALMRVLSRGAVEALSPRNVPFLTTRELFVLSAAADELRQRFAAGSPELRSEILSSLASAPLPEPAAIGSKPTWPEAEWYLSARELCGLLEELDGLPALTVRNHPLFAPLEWQRFGFKGGSEFGVLNLSAIGTAPDGRKVCAVVTANGMAAQSELAVAPLFAALFPAALR